MVTRAYFARRFLALKLLRGALVAGALYDAGLAALFLWLPVSAVALLGLGAAPTPPVAGLASIWLAMLAALGVATARDFRRYSAVIAALIGGRVAAAIVLASGAIAAGPLPLWLALWNSVLAVTLAAAWWPQRG
ncbi:MAG: hypothetical protein ACE5EG_10000 [Thermoanaerobaculia bacterium]